MLDKLLIVDMTHGGVKLAIEFSKLDSFDVYAWDIYHTLNQKQKEYLRENSIELVDEEFIKGKEFKIIAPVHSKLEYPVDMTHHEAVRFLLKNNVDIPIIEITGVKGKTSIVYMLREIFKDFKPLILSSLGVEVEEKGNWKLLKRDISITPANIITAWELGHNYDPGIFIVETSLGGTGLGRIGILTNVAEDYSIAAGSKTASQAKTQIFKDELVISDLASFNKFYVEFEEKTNTFSLDEGNVKASHISYGLKETIFQVEVQELKTISGEIVTGIFKIETFAPAPYHVENVLSAICASLTCGLSPDTIRSGLKRFHGLKGRTSLRYLDGTIVIEEINPGINVTAVKKAVEMVEELPKSTVIFGGKYGVTCEEIDEKSISTVLNELNEDVGLILADEVGAALKRRVKRKFIYREDITHAVDYARKNNYQHILLIYRSNFNDLNHR